MADFPIIDIADIDDSKAQNAIADQITKASESWGFLLLKNHGIPSGDIQQLFNLAREFFMDLPDEQKAPWPVNGNYVGYSASLSDVKKDDKASMWFRGLPEGMKSNLDALPPHWRAHVNTIEAFEQACHGLIMKLLVCFAVAMDLPDRNFFASAHVAGTQNQFRMVCYPARNNEPSASTTRMSTHTDSGSVTLIFQTCAGLEVESPTGDWVAAPYLPDHILVNLGDALSFWSGARLRATKHRVTFNGVPHDVERMTMAYFAKAAPDTVLQPVQSVGGASQALKGYAVNDMVISPGITVGEYTRLVMEGIYGAGGMQKAVPTRSSGLQNTQVQATA